MSTADKDSIVLIVEDSHSVSAEIKRSIDEEDGLRAEVAATYDEARGKFNEYGKDIFLAILDLALPDAPNGEIVDLAHSKAIPSIVFTSDSTEITRQRMISKEIVDYVVKDTHAVKNIIDYVRQLRRNRSIKVLVVEDSDSFRFNLCAQLYQQMFQVVDVASGEEALEQLKRDDDICLVIADYILPGMNGIDLTRKIRKLYPKESVSIIGMSSDEDALLTAKFIKNGANDFLNKPFQNEELYCRVNHNIEIMDCFWKLMEANRIKDQFLGMAAHDLRSPINGINGLSEMLLEGVCGDLTDEQEEIIGFIHEANAHMNGLVSDLLDISVIQAGKLQLMKSEEDLGKLIERRLRIHSIAAKKKTVLIVPALEKVRPFLFDSRRVGQVLDNLLSNAIKFSPIGGVIEVLLKVESNFAMVSVRDQGQGVPPGEEDLLFKQFEKTSVKPTAGESTTGLGLPIVKKIVEAHDGDIRVESEFGDGATFIFRLPLQ